MTLTLDHLGVVATDVARSVDFYARLLDGAVATRAGHTLVTTPSITIAVVPRRDELTYPWGAHLALRVPADRRGAILTRLRELACEHEEAGGRLYTRDPDGLVLELLFG